MCRTHHGFVGGAEAQLRSSIPGLGTIRTPTESQHSRGRALTTGGSSDPRSQLTLGWTGEGYRPRPRARTLPHPL